ncbi:MAG TPA: Rossmann-like and DUF2520 domain-containing protein [Pyrinomonadaceae bacterium]|jgi:predicted short-subunit dehydrogenase-like oxidoreductase (DUF2520 family)|nr:Rossmann-like and DUF2520 domain-containing protein [Pyrinomonadaceae bacterium]
MPDRKIKEKSQASIDVAIIGAGRLGTTLALALERRGYRIQSVVARRLENAHKAAAHLDGKVEQLAAKQLSLIMPADLVLITVPDDQIASVAAKLSAVDPDHKPVVLHTSGALSSEVLSPLRARGWSTGSLHPLISVTDPQTSLAGVFWCVEGEPRATRLAKVIVRDLGGTSFSINSAEKPLYHAAAVMTAGHVTALYDVALEMLVACGLTRKTARQILQPLLASTVHNLETKDPAHALTGSFARGDVETVKRHLAALKDHKLADALDLYCRLGKRSIKLTKKQTPITQILDGC